MKLSLFTLFAIVLGTGLTGCDSGRKAPPRTTVRVVNAAPSAPALEFRREQLAEGTINFRASIELDVGEDTYDFSVSAPGDTLVGSTFRHTVVNGVTYTVVLAELGGVVHPVVLETPNLPADAANARVIAFHGAEGQPAFDFYVVPEGTVLAAATPVTTLAFGQASSTFDLAAGLYQLWLTAPGDPSTVLFESPVFTLTAGMLASLALTGNPGDTAADVGLLATRTTIGTSVLHDRNASSQMRVLNAAADAAPRDIIVDGAAPPLFEDVPFAVLTEYRAVPQDDFELVVTPPDTAGIIEGEDTVTPGGPYLETLFITGEAGALGLTVWRDNNRRFPGASKIRFFDAATQFADGIDLYLVPPGTEISAVFPIAALQPGGASGQGTIASRDYELYVTAVGTQDVLFGPLAITLETNGLYSFLVTNGTSTSTVDVVLLEDFQ